MNQTWEDDIKDEVRNMQIRLMSLSEKNTLFFTLLIDIGKTIRLYCPEFMDEKVPIADIIVNLANAYVKLRDERKKESELNVEASGTICSNVSGSVLNSIGTEQTS